MAQVNLVFLLHSHMPYVRRNGDWPCGEEWILEAWAESYLPIWELVEDLSSATIPARMALTVTPVLCEQLQDDYLQERLVGYLENKIRQAREEIARLRGMGDEPRARLASHYEERYGRLLDSFRGRLRGRMMEILRDGMDSGRVEVLASAATHAQLPTLSSHTCRRAQMAIGLDSYRRFFQRDPAGFWLPECAYTPELDALIEEFSPPFEYVVLDFTALRSAPEKAHSWEIRHLGSTSLQALVRDELADSLVWTREGIPSHPHYREYSKRDWEGHGYQYWRVTSLHTPLLEKDLYSPEDALAQVAKDAREFAAVIRRRKEEISRMAGNPDAPRLILAAYDTELFGHWWLEGPAWLREVLPLLADETELPGRLAEKVPVSEPSRLSPRLTTWVTEGDYSTWVNPGTSEIWERVHRAEREFSAFTDSPRGENQQADRILAQAARELLLIESSDWTFMITREKASAYAGDRLESHLKRYDSLMNMLRRDRVDQAALSALEDTDNIFPWLNPDYWRKP